MGSVCCILGTIVLLGVMISVVVQTIKERSANKQAMERALGNLSGFTASKTYFSENGSAGIAIDETSQNVCLLTPHSPCRVVGFEDIVESEIVQDGYSITKSSITGQLGGAIIGGAIGGEAGAIVGGLGRKTKTEQQVKRIDLKIVVNDLTNPVHTVNFFDATAGRGMTTGGNAEFAMEAAREWQALVGVMIKRSFRD